MILTAPGHVWTNFLKLFLKWLAITLFLSHAFPRSESLALCHVISECALIRILTPFEFTLHWSGFRWCYLGHECSVWLSFVFGFWLLYLFLCHDSVKIFLLQNELVVCFVVLCFHSFCGMMAIYVMCMSMQSIDWRVFVSIGFCGLVLLLYDLLGLSSLRFFGLYMLNFMLLPFE